MTSISTPPVAAVLSARRQRPQSPSQVLAEAEEQWLFSEQELTNSPSIQDGMDREKEREVRTKGVGFIRQVGIMLKLPEITLSTAAIFFHRYLMRVSLVSTKTHKAIHHYTLGATALFLATKVEECCRKMKDLVVACCRVAQKNPNLLVDDQSKDFWKWRDTILANEDVLLETLCFDLTIEPPHKQLYSMLKTYRLENNKMLRNAAWAFVTDSCISQLCLLCSSKTIGATALYAAARLYDVQLPDDSHGRAWWDASRISLKEINKAANFMASNYESPPGSEKTGVVPPGGGPGTTEGSRSIYVGLFADYEAESGKGRDGNGETPCWDRTRLKHQTQGILTPPRQLGADATSTRQTSVEAVASSATATTQGTKRSREGEGTADNGHGNGIAHGDERDDNDIKDDHVDETAPLNTAAGEPGSVKKRRTRDEPGEATENEPRAREPSPQDGSEEGEVEE